MPAPVVAEPASTGRPPIPVSALADLHGRLAELQIRAEAAKVNEAPINPDVPTVPVFDFSGEALEVLSADGDVKRRHAQIVKTLRERGANRVLGAVASPELGKSIGSLFDSHPNFSSAVDYVLGEETLARQNHGAISGLRLLLHGGAGIGKTDFSMALANLLGIPAEVISLSSAQAAAFLAGSEEYWSNSAPGIVWKNLIQGHCANPLFILDEIDKTCDRWGDPLGALFQLLESKTASTFRDKSVPWLPIDASFCNWIATANDVESLHPAMRSRFFEIEVGSPTQNSLIRLIQRLYADLLIEFRLAERLPAELAEEQARRLTTVSIRDAKRLLRAAVARALRQGDAVIRLESPMTPDSKPRIGFL